MANPPFKKKSKTSISNKSTDEIIEAAFTLLFDVVIKIPIFVSSQTALVRLTEAKYWISHALSDMAMQQQENLKEKAKHKDE